MIAVRCIPYKNHKDKIKKMKQIHKIFKKRKHTITIYDDYIYIVSKEYTNYGQLY